MEGGVRVTVPYNSNVRRMFSAVFLGMSSLRLMSARLISGFSSVKQDRMRIALERDFTNHAGESSKLLKESKKSPANQFV